MPVSLPRLGVNVDHVATVRQARGTAYPDPVHAAVHAELGGAAQITVHLREDRRHIQDRDVRLLRETVRTRLNLEMAATQAMLAIALDVVPDMVTLVPEKREELTTEGGLDVARLTGELAPIVQALHAAGIPVSMFVDPEPAQLDATKALGCLAIELHTGTFCDATSAADADAELARLQRAAAHAVSIGLKCYAGHGITTDNVGAIASILEIEELNIGHSIVARALSTGMQAACQEMADLAAEARRAVLLERAAGVSR